MTHRDLLPSWRDYLQDAGFLEHCKGRCVLGDSFGKVCIASSRGWKMARQLLALASHSLPSSLNDPLTHGIYCRIGVWCSEHVMHRTACDFYSTRKVWDEKPARVICSSGQEDPADGGGSTSAWASCGSCWPPTQALKCSMEQHHHN